ncbi:hypothetical protein Gohar_009149, partial [Gossypium harknessii]|nr:hypothetical protein [Gossypium harknessii]
MTKSLANRLVLKQHLYTFRMAEGDTRIDYERKTWRFERSSIAIASLSIGSELLKWLVIFSKLTERHPFQGTSDICGFVSVERVYKLYQNYGHIGHTLPQCILENDFIEAALKNQVLDIHNRFGHNLGIDLKHVLFTNEMRAFLHRNNHVRVNEDGYDENVHGNPNLDVSPIRAVSPTSIFQFLDTHTVDLKHNPVDFEEHRFNGFPIDENNSSPNQVTRWINRENGTLFLANGVLLPQLSFDMKIDEDSNEISFQGWIDFIQSPPVSGDSKGEVEAPARPSGFATGFMMNDLLAVVPFLELSQSLFYDNMDLHMLGVIPKPNSNESGYLMNDVQEKACLETDILVSQSQLHIEGQD